MVVNKEEITKAFNLCAENLSYLPHEYKKWKNKLSEYRDEWEFVVVPNLKRRIAEQEMALDYLWSLEEWLKPDRVFGLFHKLFFFYGLAAIYEALLIDFWKKEFLKEKSKLLQLFSEQVNF